MSSPQAALSSAPRDVLLDHYFASYAGAGAQADFTTAPSTSLLAETNALDQLFQVFDDIG